jgi:hypothetical protein
MKLNHPHLMVTDVRLASALCERPGGFTVEVEA